MVTQFINAPIRTPRPFIWPVERQALREHALADSGADDELERYMKSAVDFIQSRYGVQINTAEFKWDLPKFHRRLPYFYPPLVNVVEMKYFDQDGNDVTFDLDKVYTYAPSDGQYGFTQVMPATAIPGTVERPDAVRIKYNAGWGLDHTAVPDRVKEAILLLTTRFMEFRTTVITGTIATELEFSLDAIMASVKSGSFAGQWQEIGRW